MKRFLVSEPLSSGTRVNLSPEESKHCTRVMRLGAGDTILLTDGKGLEAEAKILSAEKSGVVAEVKELRASASRPFRFELIQAPLKGPRMDWLMEKATELGVDALHVMDSQFAVAGGERSERWQRLAQSAMKQSGNLRLPEIHESAPLAEVLARIPSGFSGFLLSPGSPLALAEAITGGLKSGKTHVVLAIGPEGGFSREEEQAFEARGFLPCRLSSQILRGETAALAALAIALHTLEIGTSSGI
jgi:16S rRNA (uracil1498-N3)-methyltransferase